VVTSEEGVNAAAQRNLGKPLAAQKLKEKPKKKEAPAAPSAAAAPAPTADDLRSYLQAHNLEATLNQALNSVAKECPAGGPWAELARSLPADRIPQPATVPQAPDSDLVHRLQRQWMVRGCR